MSIKQAFKNFFGMGKKNESTQKNTSVVQNKKISEQAYTKLYGSKNVGNSSKLSLSGREEKIGPDILDPFNPLNPVGLINPVSPFSVFNSDVSEPSKSNKVNDNPSISETRVEKYSTSSDRSSSDDCYVGESSSSYSSDRSSSDNYSGGSYSSSSSSSSYSSDSSSSSSSSDSSSWD